MSNRRILIVDDHAMLRQVLVQVVRKELRHRIVAECSTVAEALEGCVEHEPELVVLDWMLPDGRGFDIIRRIKPKLPGTRWLAISSTEQPHVLREALSLGVQGFVMKRSSIEVLRDAIAAVLDGREYFCAECSKILAASAPVREGQRVELTNRERQILLGFARGESPKEIAAQLGISAKTVNNQLSLVKQKLAITDTVGLVRYAMRQGYIESR